MFSFTGSQCWQANTEANGPLRLATFSLHFFEARQQKPVNSLGSRAAPGIRLVRICVQLPPERDSDSGPTCPTHTRTNEESVGACEHLPVCFLCLDRRDRSLASKSSHRLYVSTQLAVPMAFKFRLPVISECNSFGHPGEL